MDPGMSPRNGQKFKANPLDLHAMTKAVAPLPVQSRGDSRVSSHWT